MKKLLYFLLLLPLAFVAASCDDDNDSIPNVDIRATFTNGVLADRVIYVVQGDTLGLDVTMINNTSKQGQLGAVRLQIDYLPVVGTMVGPNEFKIPTGSLPVGRHLLQGEMPVFVVDYPICYGYFDYGLQIVSSEDELPQPGEEQVLKGPVKIKN